jgi:hypothetical protein
MDEQVPLQIPRLSEPFCAFGTWIRFHARVRPFVLLESGRVAKRRITIPTLVILLARVHAQVNDRIGRIIEMLTFLKNIY